MGPFESHARSAAPAPIDRMAPESVRTASFALG